MEGQNSLIIDGYRLIADRYRVIADGYRYLREVSSSLVMFLFSFGKHIDKKCSTYTDIEYFLLESTSEH